MRDLPGPTRPMSKLALLVGESGRPPCLEYAGGPVSRHQPRTALQRQADRGTQKERTMVGASARRRRIIEAVADLYAWIDEQLACDPVRSGRCAACGACCDFASYDHRLFVTPLELIYLAQKLHTPNLKPMKSARCPYQEGGK